MEVLFDKALHSIQMFKVKLDLCLYIYLWLESADKLIFFICKMFPFVCILVKILHKLILHKSKGSVIKVVVYVKKIC